MIVCEFCAMAIPVAQYAVTENVETQLNFDRIELKKGCTCALSGR